MKKHFIEAWVPRGLVSIASTVAEARVTVDGLCALRVGWDGRHITSIQVLDRNEKAPSKVLLPRMLEPHAHIDKAFTVEAFPNFEGTYDGALLANLKEHGYRTFSTVRSRGERALRLALFNGLRAIRTHVDSFGP